MLFSTLSLSPVALQSLRVVCKQWNSVICTSLTLRRVSWHAEYLPPAGTEWPPRTEKDGQGKPMLCVTSERAVYHYVDVEGPHCQTVVLEPNPAFRRKLGVIRDWPVCDLRDGIAVEINNSSWATMHASRPSTPCWHFEIIRKGAPRYEYDLISVDGPILVGDVVCMWNELRRRHAIAPGAGDKEPWEGMALPIWYMEKGQMPPEQIPDQYAPVRGGMCYNRIAAASLIVANRYVYKTGCNVFVLNRPDFTGPGPWKYEHIACEAETDDWLENLAILFGHG